MHSHKHRITKLQFSCVHYFLLHSFLGGGGGGGYTSTKETIIIVCLWNKKNYKMQGKLYKHFTKGKDENKRK